eukprot:jgi/Mesen1/7374/ME000382S06572
MGPKLVARASSFLAPSSKHSTYIDGHPFNSALELLLPFPHDTDAAVIKSSVTQCASQLEPLTGSFHVLRTSVASFLEQAFLDKYIRGQGHFVALSSGTAIDRTDVVGIAAGKLHMAVTRDTYHRLGLTGKASELTPGQRYNICIDLRAPSFVAGRKLHDRVLECLQLRAAAMEFLCTFALDELPGEISLPAGVRAHKLAVRRVHHTLPAFPLPPIGALGASKDELSAPAGSTGEDNEEEEGGGDLRWETGACPLEAECLTALHEWLGAAACRVQSAGGGNGQAAGYEWLAMPWPGEPAVGHMHALHWTGLIHPAQVKATISQARLAVDSGQCPFAAVNVWGFADAPVSWAGAEHGYLRGGENDYSFVIFPGGRYLVFSASGASDCLR